MMGFKSPTPHRARTQGVTDGHRHLGSLSSFMMASANGHTRFISRMAATAMLSDNWKLPLQTTSQAEQQQCFTADFSDVLGLMVIHFNSKPTLRII